MKNVVPYRPGMTLGPGQSTSVSCSIPVEEAAAVYPDEADGGGPWIPLRMVRVPPPDAAPVQTLAQSLGLINGLRAELTDHAFRCAECHHMQRPGSHMVWVPDGVRRKDPAWSVEEACRVNAFNGHSSGWCLDCAQRLGRGRKQPLAIGSSAQVAASVPTILVIASVVGLIVLFGFALAAIR